MEDQIVFNSFTSIAMILTLIVIGNKDIKVGFFLLVFIMVFYLSQLS